MNELQRWWLLAGEVAATVEANGRTAELVFDYDDGALWGFTLRGLPQEHTVIWDHEAGAMELSLENEATIFQAGVRSAILAISAPRAGWTLTASERVLLDKIAQSLRADEWMTGRKLRAVLGLARERFDRIKKPLLPRYLRETSGDHGDYYSLTLPGLLACSESGTAGRILEATLATFSEKFAADPDVLSFTLDDVVSKGNFSNDDRAQIVSVLSIANLHGAMHGSDSGRELNRTYRIPQDIEALVSAKSLSDFIDLSRHSRMPHPRVWPTAPVCTGQLLPVNFLATPPLNVVPSPVAKETASARPPPHYAVTAPARSPSVDEDGQAGRELFTWIHLSDIHFGHGSASHGAEQALVTTQLIEDVSSFVRAQAITVKAILVTGDIAFSGGDRGDEYGPATHLLDALRTAANAHDAHVLVVPGNHDVQWSADKSSSVRRAVQELRSSDRLDEQLGSHEDCVLLANRLERYLNFARRWLPEGTEFGVPEALGPMFWALEVPLPAVAPNGVIRFAGLNTAFSATGESHPARELQGDDRGKLTLGRKQIQLALKEREGRLVVLLTHHPIRSGWLRDEAEVSQWLRNHAHVILSGHMHDSLVQQSTIMGRQFVEVLAGALHGEQGQSADHAYNIGILRQLDGDAVGLRVHHRRWSIKRKSFIADHELHDPSHNYADHTLAFRRLRLVRKTVVRDGDVAVGQAPRAPSTTASQVLSCSRFWL